MHRQSQGARPIPERHLYVIDRVIPHTQGINSSGTPPMPINLLNDLIFSSSFGNINI